ncbi:MAG: DUF4331 family protein [Candidatus Eremiobacteraeota bacterium]|nr:DUF4331 family protein [Candidatus Eremiobacteraeota bacterium]MBC5804360.1 DUF4331 family protein [Candidatus Eremiobacteraeota bacterium]MBC5822079.1 DUF4331 family protein [Candidatus Eremiobacteraeota bacterium]
MLVGRTLAASAAIAALGAASVLYAAGPARTSDHQDTLQLVSRPGADITDGYVFPSKNPNDVTFIMNVHPLIPRGMGATTYFDPGVMYQIKMDTVGDYREHQVMQFKAEGAGPDQKITLYGPAAPSTQGTTATFVRQLGTAAYNTTVALPDGIKFFAGPRRDPFYFDLTQFFKINPDRNYKNQPNPPAPSASCFRPPGQAMNTLANFNVLSLIVEMPRSMLETAQNHGRINVWWTASTTEPQAGGAYRQIELWGRPAVKEALEPFRLHEVTNRSEPYNDPALRRAIYRFMTAPKPYGAGRSHAIANALVKVLGNTNEMQVDLTSGGPATYLGVETKGKSGLPKGILDIVPGAGLKGLKKSLRNGAREFGGRDPESPVVDLSLGAIYGNIVSKVGLAKDDHKETPCLTSDNLTPTVNTLNGFPYLTAPV